MRIKKPKFSKTPMTDAVLLNEASYFDYLERLKKIALSMFEWENLPDSMNARWLERCLYYTGKAGLLKTENWGFINTQVADGGYINIYGLPTTVNCYSFEFHETRDVYTGLDNGSKKDCVLVLNNYEKIPTASTIQLFAYRLAQAERTADVNMQALRTPILITTDEKQKFTMKKLYEQYDGNTPVIFGDANAISQEAIKVLNTEAPFLALNIKEYQRKIWNEALTYLGISNLDEKRERLISNEIDSNNELINLNLQSYLAPRKEACEQFNRLHGTNINVKVRSDLYNIVKQAESIVSEYESRENLDDAITDLGEGA